MSPLFPVPVGEHSGPAIPAENSTAAPAEYPIDTWVMVDGVKVPCLADDLADGTPTVLDGLSFSWGRETAIDQPDTNTCSFTLREQIRPNDVTMLDVIHVGSTVEVWSGASVPALDAEVMRDTGFSRFDGGPLPDDRWAVIDGTTPDAPAVEPFTGSDPAAWFIRYDQFDDWTAGIGIPPTAYATGDDQPNKWDLIPKLAPGITWTITATVWAPPGTTVSLAAWAYSGPHTADLVGPCPVTGSAASATGTIDELIGGTDGWFTLTGTVTLPADQTDPAGLWIVPGISIDPLPSPTTWAEGPGNWADQVLRWVDLQRVGISYLSLLQAEASPRTVLIWSGEVTSLVGQAAGNQAWTIAVTASDLSSILANVKIGDEPWPVMTVQERADAIMAQLPTAPPLNIDSTLTATQVSYRDVDAQPPLGLLQDLAQTAGGVLWITAHATLGVYLWMEDPASRSAVRRFAIDPDTGAVYIDDGTGTPISGVAVISARDILRDPVSWTQDVNSVITQASVSWLEQGTDEDGQVTTTDHTEVVQDTAEIIDQFGIRDVSVSTELISAADAETLAARILALSRGTGWIADGLNVDTILLTRDIPPISYSQRLSTVLDLLDATTRIGYAITIIDLPVWTPAGGVRSMYVEGGTYSWTDHRWQLELTASPASGQGTSARWEDFTGTGVTWEDFRPNRIKWLDAYGTAGPVIEQERAEING